MTGYNKNRLKDNIYHEKLHHTKESVIVKLWPPME